MNKDQREFQPKSPPEIRSELHPELHPELDRDTLQELKEQLNETRIALLERRDQAQRNALCEANSSGEISRVPHDKGDLGSEASDQNLQIIYAEFEEARLREIDHALEKIDNDEYGFCEGTGEPIPLPRLKAVPECRFRVEYQKMLEETSPRGEAKIENLKHHTIYQHDLNQDFPRFRT